uniref:Rhodanese domain-containing protein n=1 Tax=Rhizophora mucronata TaxID=61149 RepID=A0A2P2J363_RHIMU
MESLSMVLASAPLLQNYPKTLEFKASKTYSHQSHFLCITKSSLQRHLSFPKQSFATKTSLSFTAIQLFASLPCLASETLISSTEQGSDRINLESILVSIDDFFNRNPFFVAGCTFIWLVVIPLTEEYLRKYKFISAIDAFRKLRDNPDAQLLDIRVKKSLAALGSPNLKILNKSVAQVEFSETGQDGFVKTVLEKFQDPANTILCILDNFDGNSMKVAESLVKKGFKEAYAIRGGVRGKNGWLDIQETLLPPSTHIYPRKQKTKISQVGLNGGVAQQNEDKNETSSVSLPIRESPTADNGYVNTLVKSTPHVKIDSRSPYPNVRLFFSLFLM